MTVDEACVKEAVGILRATFKTRKTFSAEWRETQLNAILRLLEEQGDEIAEALKQDLRKPKHDSRVIETDALKKDVQYMLKNLRSWMKPKYPGGFPWHQRPGSAMIVPEPLGVVLVMGPWNFPFMLTMAPVVGAIAAGNCVVIKPSEHAPQTSALIKDLVAKYLDTEAITVLEGDATVAQTIMREKFSHIFFTGGNVIGQKIYEAAAKHLTPVTLELGGKCPAYVDQDSNIEVSAKRILWAKTVNAGQVCMSPDYVLVSRSISADFKKAITKALEEFIPGGKPDPDGYCRILNERHFQRLETLLNETEEKRGRLIAGGYVDRKELTMGPAIFENTAVDSLLMAEEIFGPLLPIIEVENLDEALEFINSRPNPLLAYCYGTNQTITDRFTTEVEAGMVGINEAIMIYRIQTLPFGGCGASGIGKYKGWYSFETFSNMKSVFKKAALSFLESDLRYPPVTPEKLKILDWIL